MGNYPDPIASVNIPMFHRSNFQVRSFSANPASSVRDNSFFLSPAPLGAAEFTGKATNPKYDLRLLQVIHFGVFSADTAGSAGETVFYFFSF